MGFTERARSADVSE